MNNLERFAEVAFPWDELEKSWKWHLLLGCLFIAAGVIGLLLIPLSTLSTVVVFAFFMMAGGIVQLVDGIRAGEARRRIRVLHIIGGGLYALGGLVMLLNPVAASLALTFLFAVIIFAGGLLRIVLAWQHKDEIPDWPIVLAGGIASLCLGILIGISWPYSGLWALGLVISVDLIFNGCTHVMVALGLGRNR